MPEKPTSEELEQRVKELTKVTVEYKQAQKALRDSEERYRQIFNIAPAGIYELDFRTGKIIEANAAICEYSGYTREELLAINPVEMLTEKSQKRFLNRMNRAISGKSIEDTTEYEIISKDGSIGWYRISNRYIYEGDNMIGATVVARDITDSKKAIDELESKSERLRETNAALNVLLKNLGSKESDFQEQVTANIQHLVLPYLVKIRNTAADSTRKSLLDIVESNLNKITENFTHQLSSNLYRLTSTEIKVADLVRTGKTTKEIGAALNISYKTVESHRERIRKKLGIKNKKINLRSHLLSIK